MPRPKNPTVELLDRLSQPREPKIVRLDWEFLPKSLKLITSRATNKLAIGGQRSGKTSNALMHGILNFALQHPGLNMLCLRRTYKQLEEGVLGDFRALIPKEIYKFNETRKVATFPNGSRVVFGHLSSGKEADIRQYLGTAYPFILLDECGEFSFDAYSWLKSRNLVNTDCKPDKHGNYPIPEMWACTNPVGPYWTQYKQIFIEKTPLNPPEGTIRDKRGDYWIKENGVWRIVFDADHYVAEHSTVFDNPYMLEKDPGIIDRLNAMPPDLRKKMLFGDLDGISGQYYDCFSHEHHVVNLKNDPDDIKWEDWQPHWIGWDWGRNHASAMIWMTLAQVKQLDGTYRQKVVVYKERILKGMTGQQLVHELVQANSNDKLTSIFFSHEMFAKKWEQHSPADEASKMLRAANLPAVTRGSTLRVERAAFLYEKLKHGNIVILHTCPETIKAIPSAVRDDKRIEDFLKTNTDSDDVLDALTGGLFMQLGNRPKPAATKNKERIEALAENPFAQHLAVMRLQFEEKRRNELAVLPSWARRYEESKKK